jgi:hypothetical protein
MMSDYASIFVVVGIPGELEFPEAGGDKAPLAATAKV